MTVWTSATQNQLEFEANAAQSARYTACSLVSRLPAHTRGMLLSRERCSVWQVANVMQVEEDTDRDRYMSPLEAKQYGLIDYIIGGDEAGFQIKGDTRHRPMTKREYISWGEVRPWSSMLHQSTACRITQQRTALGLSVEAFRACST